MPQATRIIGDGRARCHSRHATGLPSSDGPSGRRGRPRRGSFGSRQPARPRRTTRLAQGHAADPRHRQARQPGRAPPAARQESQVVLQADLAGARVGRVDQGVRIRRLDPVAQGLPRGHPKRPGRRPAHQHPVRDHHERRRHEPEDDDQVRQHQDFVGLPAVDRQRQRQRATHEGAADRHQERADQGQRDRCRPAGRPAPRRGTRRRPGPAPGSAGPPACPARSRHWRGRWSTCGRACPAPCPGRRRRPSPPAPPAGSASARC